MSNDNIIGQNIRRLRDAADLTQLQLAERAGISRIMASYAERGEHVPRNMTLKKIATALGVTVDDLTKPSASAAPTDSGFDLKDGLQEAIDALLAATIEAADAGDGSAADFAAAASQLISQLHSLPEEA